jgi:hypothetical protein
MARKRLAVPTARAGASSVRQRLFECLRPRQCPARPSNVDACATRWPSSPPISGIRSEAASPHRHPIRQRRSSSRSAFGPSLRRHGHVFPRRDFNGPEAEDATDASGARALLLLSPSLCIQHWAATTWSASSAPRLRALLPLRAGAGAACSSHRPPSQRGQFRWPRSRRSLQWIARCSPPPHFIGHEDPPERAWRLSLAALDGQTSRWRARCRSSTAASNSLCAKPAATHIARLWAFAAMQRAAASAAQHLTGACGAGLAPVSRRLSTLAGRLAAAGSRLRLAATAAATAPLLTELCNAQQLAGPGAARLQPFSTSPGCATGIRAHKLWRPVGTR